MNTSVDQKLKKIILSNINLDITTEEIRDETNILNDFFLDSLQIVNIISDIETQFQIELYGEGSVLELFTKYSDLLDNIIKLTSHSNGPI